MIRFLQQTSIAALISLVFLGCSGEAPRYAATGTVSMDGAPAPFVVVKFISPMKDSMSGGSGTTDDQGKFKIGEDGKNTGLQAGDYKVTFSQTLVKGKPTFGGSGGKIEEKEKTEKEAVADDYRDAEKTPITAKIGSGSNSFTFEVKKK